jgi:ribosome-binding protein aMBF1 (putative translation factor)
MCLRLCPADFALRLRAARLAAGLSESALARRLAVQAADIRRWERRWRTPRGAVRAKAERWIARGR